MQEDSVNDELDLCDKIYFKKFHRISQNPSFQVLVHAFFFLVYENERKWFLQL